jgi:S1-C subfamily serine protease
MKLISHIALLLIILSLTSRIGFLSYAETYKWTDEEGVVHFSDRLSDINNSSYEIIPVKKQADTTGIKPVISSEKTPGLHKNPIEHATDCTFTVKGKKNIGTGFFISPNGYAITCKHVIENEPSHIAVLNNNEEYPIGVISTSSEHDIALILVTTVKKTPFLEFRDPFTLKPGEKVYAVGSSIGLQSTVTDGLFSGQRKQMSSEQRTIQFSAPVNPGNSGGPLIDKDGKVIGAISWKLLSNKGIPVTGIGFAVPSDYILKEYRRYMD